MAVGVRLLLIVGLLAVLPLASEAANILGVFTSHSPSHLIIHMTYVKALVERGHNVTVMTTIPLKEKNLRFNHIYIPPSEEIQQEMEAFKSQIMKQHSAIKFMKGFSRAFAAFGRSSFEAIKDQRFQELLHNPDNKFDLMILGYFMSDHELGIASHLKCPVVISWMAGSNIFVDHYVGNPPEISYVPATPMFTAGDPLTFTGRLRNFFIFCVSKAVLTLVHFRVGHYYNELFPAPEHPPLNEIGKKVSLMFVNSHFSEGIIRPNVPAIVDVGGIQIKDKPDPLPKSLDAIVGSSSEHGVVYVSFGSNMGTEYMDNGFVEKIYHVLASLKQTVLWKWDGQEKPGNASNIHFEKWLPQDDLLAHPNMRLFITHAGKGSVAEAQYHAVPMVAIPMFADQPLNAQQIVNEGFGVKVDHSTMTAESLKSAVMEVLENPKYKDSIQRFSNLYRDRPMTPRETAVYWIEYVIRHKGAYHMQSPLVHLNGFQYMSLDVIAFLLLVAYLTFTLFKISVNFVCKLIRGLLCSKKQKIKKQ